MKKGIDKEIILWKRWRAGNQILDRFLMIILICIMLLGIYSIYDSLYLLGFNPTDLSYYFEGGKEEWDKMPDDAVGWITIYDSYIDYPVMQGKDNNEYLNKDPYGEFALSGSIFMDFRNNSEWNDNYNLLYGHHMSGNRMFGSLDLFLDEEYFNSHTEGILKTRAADYSVELFAVIKDSAVNSLFFDAGDEGHESEEICKYLEDNALIYREPKGDKLISLTTCQMTGSTERLIVLGTLTVTKEPGTIYDPGDLIEPDDADTTQQVVEPKEPESIEKQNRSLGRED